MTETRTFSKLIMGTWQAGKTYWPGVTTPEIKRAVEAAVEVGVTSFDTAEEYGDGLSEQTLAAVVGPHRPKLQLLSKVFSNHLRAAQVTEACHRSLKNLNTDYLDLYQIHWPAGSWGGEAVPIEETMGALVCLREQGKILRIGVSNFSLTQLKAANVHSDITTIQPPYNLFWRAIDRDLRPYCETHNIQILAYCALAQGLLTGKFKPDHVFHKDDNRADNRLFKPANRKPVFHALERLRPIAKRLDVSLAQLALAWCMAQPLTYPIVGARNPAQITDSAAAMHLNIAPTDLAEIDALGREVAAPFMADPLLWDWNP